VPEACTTLLGDCEADLQSLLVSIEENGWWELFYARIGCGLTEIGYDFGLGGSVYVFDTNGTLVGYSFFGDVGWGPCTNWQYQRGEHIGDCPDLRDCALALDAAETGVLCRCPCPEPPPDNGVAIVEASCVERPSIGWGCADGPRPWTVSGTGLDGTIRTGCGATVMTFMFEEDDLECVWIDTEELVGQTRWSKTPTGCNGVTAFHNGVPYVSCADESICAFGDADVGPYERCP